MISPTGVLCLKAAADGLASVALGGRALRGAWLPWWTALFPLWFWDEPGDLVFSESEALCRCH